MTTKRLATGHYELTGTTSLDGKLASIRVKIWKHEDIKGCWMSEVEIDGRSTGSHNDHCFKDSAVNAAKRCAEAGYKTVAGFGVCCN
jgi:hypothetical protein